jgi:hypothetical protein
MLAKDESSGEQGCPSAYVLDGEFVIQGPQFASLGDLANVLPGETAVRISPQVLRDALARYDAGQ